MVQGTSSWAGKSLLATALARAVRAPRASRVAPFKAQNMSNNARVVDGGEIGVAQYLQALAARRRARRAHEPGAGQARGRRRAARSCVLGAARPRAQPRAVARAPGRAVAGRSRRAFARCRRSTSCASSRARAARPRSTCATATSRTCASRGSPTRRVLLVADIDRGGAFAHLYGTWALLEPERPRALSRLRAEQVPRRPRAAGARARAAARALHRRPDRRASCRGSSTGCPTRTARPRRGAPAAGPRVAVVRYPTALEPRRVQGARAGRRRRRGRPRPADLRGAELVVLPGSKHVAADLAWLRERGFAAPSLRDAPRGARHLRRPADARRRDRGPRRRRGQRRGLRPAAAVRTTFAARASARAAHRARFADAARRRGRRWPGSTVRGYEIRHGRTRAGDGAAAALDRRPRLRRPVACSASTCTASSRTPASSRRCSASRPERSLDDELDLLADAVGRPPRRRRASLEELT